MQAIPKESEFGNWDVLPPKVKTNNTSEMVKDLINRRNGLAAQHKKNLTNSCAIGRNWALRQNHSGFCYLNNLIRRLGEKT